MSVPGAVLSFPEVVYFIFSAPRVSQIIPSLQMKILSLRMNNLSQVTELNVGLSMQPKSM